VNVFWTNPPTRKKSRHSAIGRRTGITIHGQKAGEDLEAEVFLVAEPVRAALEDADLVVQPLDEPERDLVVRAAVGRDAVPVPETGRALRGVTRRAERRDGV
jgi:hypothetical protein